jgi:hypothetical protein
MDPISQLELTPTNQTTGLAQTIYSTKYPDLFLVHCAKCHEVVGTRSMWCDKDNSMRHLDCLSKARLKELEAK